jgi:hypothetical protein
MQHFLFVVFVFRLNLCGLPNLSSFCDSLPKPPTNYLEILPASSSLCCCHSTQFIVYSLLYIFITCLCLCVHWVLLLSRGFFCCWLACERERVIAVSVIYVLLFVLFFCRVHFHLEINSCEVSKQKLCVLLLLLIVAVDLNVPTKLVHTT